jgi:hypothetical protein
MGRPWRSSSKTVGFEVRRRSSRRLKGRSPKYTDRPARLSAIPFRSGKFAEPDRRNFPGRRFLSTTCLMTVRSAGCEQGRVLDRGKEAVITSHRRSAAGREAGWIR